jgi:hypothetical protein
MPASSNPPRTEGPQPNAPSDRRSTGTKEKAERWTRWRAFAQVRHSSNIQLQDDAEHLRGLLA